MKRAAAQIIFVSLMVLLLPGCTRYYGWALTIMKQGQPVDTYINIVMQYIRSEHVYDGFKTLAHFDVLWLSDEVRTVYSLVRAQKRCLTQNEYNNLLQEELDLNKKFISFYVLSAIRHNYGSDLLDSENAEWSMCLCVEDTVYKPISIEEVELGPEITLFFGKRYTVFKNIYQVNFDAKDSRDNSILATAGNLTLCFNRVDRKISLTWCLDGAGRVMRQSMYNPDILAYCYPCGNM